MEKRKIIIDTDCGSDDAMAIAMALNDDNYEIIMFTTVAGNVRVDQATSNLLTTLKVCNKYYPDVYVGCDEMLVRDWVGAAETHGNDGMGDLDLVDYSLKPKEGHAVLKMLEALRNHKDKEIDIVALGPLTNIALALKLDKKTMMKVNRLYVMGTAGLGVGNVSPVAEFNIWQDPEACKAVLEAGFEYLMFIGWDACLDEAMLNKDEIKQIRESGEVGKFCIDSNITLQNLNVVRFGEEYLDMADPAAMAAALYPECIAICDKYYCEADTSPGPSYGAVLVDYYRFTEKPANAYICSKLKPDLYKKYIIEKLKV